MYTYVCILIYVYIYIHILLVIYVSTSYSLKHLTQKSIETFFYLKSDQLMQKLKGRTGIYTYICKSFYMNIHICECMLLVQMCTKSKVNLVVKNKLLFIVPIQFYRFQSSPLRLQCTYAKGFSIHRNIFNTHQK